MRKYLKTFFHVSWASHRKAFNINKKILLIGFLYSSSLLFFCCCCCCCFLKRDCCRWCVELIRCAALQRNKFDSSLNSQYLIPTRSSALTHTIFFQVSNIIYISLLWNLKHENEQSLFDCFPHLIKCVRGKPIIFIMKPCTGEESLGFHALPIIVYVSCVSNI